MITLLGILFVLVIAFLIGDSVGRLVPDEIEPAQQYTTFFLDATLLAMTALLLTAFGWGPLTAIVILLLVLARAVVPFDRAYAPVSGAIVAASMFAGQDVFVTEAVLGLALTYIAGTRKEAVEWIAQSASAIVAFGLIVLIP